MARLLPDPTPDETTKHRGQQVPISEGAIDTPPHHAPTHPDPSGYLKRAAFHHRL